MTPSLDRSPLERRTFAAALIAITIVFGWAIWPFAGAILWSVVAAIMFTPLNRRITEQLRGRPSLAAAVTLLVFTAAVVIPAILLTSFLLDRAAGIYTGIRSGQIDIGRTFLQVQAAMPGWLLRLLARLGITDLASLRETLSAGVATRLQILTSGAVAIGQGAASFLLALAVVLYLTFFLLRDGQRLAAGISPYVPLAPADRSMFSARFVEVIRATVVGGILVGVAQGVLGGMVMALLGVPNAALWAVLMALSSLLPAVGTGLVWVPVSLFLLATGSTWQGIIMALSGLFLIGSVDNVLRPILIGRRTKMPDFLVLVATLGGLASFGFNGLLMGPVAAALFLSGWQTIRRPLPIHFQAD
jgi:predicted PurR-regulated permease PerM